MHKCGKGILKKPPNEILKYLHDAGCIDAILPKMREKVVPLMIIIASTSGAIGIGEIVTIIVLIFAKNRHSQTSH